MAFTGDGAVDTGFAISNTTADPLLINTKAQKGSVTLYFWTSDGSAAPTPRVLATALDAGQTTTFVASSLGTGFTGYAIAVCQFQLGHGLAAFLDAKTGIFGASYLAISVTNPRFGAPAGITESGGH